MSNETHTASSAEAPSSMPTAEQGTVPLIAISQAGQHMGETVQLRGWLYNLRKSGKIVFPILRDGSGLMQCVAVKSALPEELFEELKHLTQESSLIVRGRIRAEARAPGGYEM